MACIKNNGPDNNVKVLFITSLLDKMGGAEKNLCDMATHIDRRRFTPCIACLQGGETANQMRDAGIPVKEYKFGKLISYKALKQGYALYKFIKKEAVEVVVTYHHDADIWGLLVSKLAGVPVIISSRRDMGYQLASKHIWAYRLLNRYFSKIVTVSDAVKNEIMASQWIKPDKMTTIYNGIEVDKINRELLHAKRDDILHSIGVDPSYKIIGTVASFRPVKGQEFIVEAMKEIVAKRNDVRVVIVGYTGTDYYHYVNGLIKKYGFEDYFICTGDKQDAWKMMTAFDIFVLSSITEGFSNALIESMASGVPAVVSDGGGNAEVVLHNETGLLFPPKDSATLAKMLLALLDDSQLRQQMGEMSKRKVEELFSLSKMVSNNQNLYLSLLGVAGATCTRVALTE